mmetsp:Transcript_13857/g.41329  ORF Transcript_13857/g.41329 Transcript_13857/m.41329 type:complete len:200 (+) Transcript_13857:314-913(+)
MHWSVCRPKTLPSTYFWIRMTSLSPQGTMPSTVSDERNSARPQRSQTCFAKTPSTRSVHWMSSSRCRRCWTKPCSSATSMICLHWTGLKKLGTPTQSTFWKYCGSTDRCSRMMRPRMLAGGGSSRVWITACALVFFCLAGCGGSRISMSILMESLFMDACPLGVVSLADPEPRSALTSSGMRLIPGMRPCRLTFATWPL